MTNEEAFVNELIGYIFAYPEDDYMTMECLCRKLHKHGLIERKDGEWTTDFIERKTEQTDERLKRLQACIDCEHTDMCEWCHTRWSKTEPQTDNGIGCSRCEGRFDCYDRDMPHAVHCNNYGKITDEPQTDRDRPQGEWTCRNPYWHTAICSNCNKETMFEEWDGKVMEYNYCPNCGARMKGADDETYRRRRAH